MRPSVCYHFYVLSISYIPLSKYMATGTPQLARHLSLSSRLTHDRQTLVEISLLLLLSTDSETEITLGYYNKNLVNNALNGMTSFHKSCLHTKKAQLFNSRMVNIYFWL